MKAKLTLSVDEELIKFAHRQAHGTGKSISDLFSDFLQAQKNESTHGNVPKINAMIGSLKGYEINDSKPAVREL